MDVANDPEDPKGAQDEWEKLKRHKEEAYHATRAEEPVQWLRRKDAEEERKQVRQICHMRCPSCGESLKERAFENVIIQSCPECGGLWIEAQEAGPLSEIQGTNIFARLLTEIRKKVD